MRMYLAPKSKIIITLLHDWSTNSQTMSRSRFAPSPTGPLHMGSLIAAVGSFLEARCAQLQWHIRIENIDTPRIVPGADAMILRSLERHGLSWDGPVVYQSQRLEHYQRALQQLRDQQLIYPCTCSRKDIARSADIGPYGRIYPGTCRAKPRQSSKPVSTALRLRTPPGSLSFNDRIQGYFDQHLQHEVGDFVVQRADAIFAYQLAVVVDDGLDQFTHIVRGSDLLDSTPRQIYLQRLLGLPTPDYSHLPIAVDDSGHKLSKQTGATALNDDQPERNLFNSLCFLGQQPPADLRRAQLQTIWSWAFQHWNLKRIPKQRAAVLSLYDLA